MCSVQRFAFGVGNGEVLRSLRQILLIFSVAPEKVTQNNVIHIISTNKNKVVRVLNELKLTRRSLVRQRIFFSHFFAILVLIFFSTDYGFMIDLFCSTYIFYILF